ncbi:hypothetical protein AXX12_12060 [Anaerosporomusa subterranea]|uniref:Uncharacterized protein n=1 Tax=Anaerosporomusa subterranea TaxID=1794912 RepID=A0A154BND2_ANASB|nr:hypothetical protein AXX12_12060 [Anaerosporomusa subterranea]
MIIYFPTSYTCLGFAIPVASDKDNSVMPRRKYSRTIFSIYGTGILPSKAQPQAEDNAPDTLCVFGGIFNAGNKAGHVIALSNR